MKSISTWRLIRSSMERNIPVMLLYVLEAKEAVLAGKVFLWQLMQLAKWKVLLVVE